MVNLGVIGTGWITDDFVQGAHASGGWKLVAVYSRNADTAKTFGAKFGVEKALYTSLDELAQDEAVQAVYIASPNSLHYDQTKFLLNHKKHIILEKPATSTSAELDELFALAREKGVFLIEAYRHIQEANFKIWQRALERLGPIYGASLQFAQYSSRYNAVLDGGPLPNIFSRAFSAGALVDVGVYPICAAVTLFGKPVSQTYTPIILESGGDAGGLVVLNYKGFAVSCQQSKCYASRMTSEVYGEKGTLNVNAITDIDRVTFLDARGKKEEELAGKKEDLNLMEEAKEFARIIESSDTAAASRLEEISRNVQAVTEDLRHQHGLIFDAEKKDKVAIEI